MLNNAVVAGDGKNKYFIFLADWIEKWRESPNFKLTPHTSSALVITLRAQAMLIDELLTDDGYSYVLTARLQSDAIERRFSRYRQMSGGRFLVSLREVLNSERILACRSLLKENINFWEENLRPDIEYNVAASFDEIFNSKEDEIANSVLDNDSQEVSTTIAGYIARKLVKRTKCEPCKASLSVHDDELANDTYLSVLSRGGLFVPSKKIADFVSGCFAALDYISDDLVRMPIPVRESATYALEKYGPTCNFTCDNHVNWGFIFATKIVVNIFFNNAQKLAADSVTKESISGFKKRQRTK